MRDQVHIAGPKLSETMKLGLLGDRFAESLIKPEVEFSPPISNSSSLNNSLSTSSSSASASSQAQSAGSNASSPSQLLNARDQSGGNSPTKLKQQAAKLPLSESPKSPVLVKYNYYDFSGTRREQTPDEFAAINRHHQQNSAGAQGKIQRQLSPTFRQQLDWLISRSASQQQQSQLNESAGNGGPYGSEEQAVGLQLRHRRYQPASYQQLCLRCRKQVYQMDKVGPLKDLTFYHQNCFKCFECGTKLTLKTYFNNQQAADDREVYCHRHCPKIGAGRLDGQSVGIRTALNAPKVFEQIAGLNFELPSSNSQSQQQQVHPLNIQHAIEQTRMQHFYRDQQIAATGNQQRQLAQLANQRLQFLEPKQKMLELRHRREEDELFKAFQRKLIEEEQRIGEQVRAEWQLELAKLLAKYERKLGKLTEQNAASKTHLDSLEKSDSNNQLLEDELDQQSPREPSKLIEFERLNLENTMTIKLDRKRETLKRKLKEFERQATAEMVEKQSREMLALVSLKLDEFKKQQQKQVDSDRRPLEIVADRKIPQAGEANKQYQQQQQQPQRVDDRQPDAESLAAMLNSSARISGHQKTERKQQDQGTSQLELVEVPAPSAPKSSKLELYQCDNSDELFREIDQAAISVAQADQQSFTDLVHHLTRNCLGEIEKVRAIFRWITVKNLNTMQFDSSLAADTPLGLLRGIKNGSESYHVLFKRLCSYAGLHCVVIKGYSKSAGYQPGLSFQGNRFRNSWNAVHVAGSWRFVQCNWGARHLVSVAVMQDNKGNNGVDSKHNSASQGRQSQNGSGNGSGVAENQNQGRRGGQRAPTRLQRTTPNANGPTSQSQAANDSLRYEYDDHYFLTDPDEFIYEFFPLNPEWQLVRGKPLSLSQFEQLPFVRSLFFKYGLYFPQAEIRSVLQADSSGAATVKIGMPTHLVPSLIFHYNLKRCNSDQDHHEGVNLKRFVMQSVEYGSLNGAESNGNILANIVSFRVHLPEAGAYILDIFANSITPTQYITGEPMKFKSVYCASGEFGPMKATRLFGIIPLSHESGLISVSNDKRHLEIQFRMTRNLQDFMATLHKNGHDERQLSKAVKIFIEGDIVTMEIKFPEDGQYGLDIYTRETQQQTNPGSTKGMTHVESSTTSSNDEIKTRQLLTHCCKYLINVRSPSSSSPSANKHPLNSRS